MLVCALVASSCAQQPQKPKLPVLPEIIVPASAMSEESVDWARTKHGRLKGPESPLPYTTVKKTLAGWLMPEEIVRIRVEKYLRNAPQNPGQAITRILSVDLEGRPSGWIWAEGVEWSIDAKPNSCMISSMRRTTLILNDRRLAEVKRIAADRGQTISAVVDEFLSEGVRRAQAPKRRSVSLPVFNMGEAAVNIADRDQLFDLLERE